MMDLLETLAAAGLEATALQQTGNNTVSLGWPTAGAVLAPGLPMVAGGAEALCELGSVLGQGGMGVVVAARQHGLERSIAVKRLHDPGNPDRAAALVREAQVVAAVAHPNVVPVHVLGTDEHGAPLLAMKRIAGESWAEAIAREESPDRTRREDGAALERHLRVLIRVAEALGHAHSRDVVHRDVKPSNVMLGEHGEVYVVDWGLAAAVGPAAPPGLPRADDVPHIAGTPGYLAPEQATGDGESIGPQTDIFLLGATLYRVVAGAPPHRGANALERLHAALSSEPPPLPDDVPDALVAILRRAMAWEPADRYPSTAELVSALEEFLRGRPMERVRAEGLVQLRTLERLVRDGAPASTVEAAFGGCRFALRQVLDHWPEDPAASDGLQRAVRVMVRQALEGGRVSAAQALIGELPTPESSLAQECADAMTALKARDTRLGELEHLTDGTYGDWERGLITLLPSLLWAAIHVGLGAWSRREGVAVDVGGYALFLGCFLIGGLLAAWPAREKLFLHPANRRTTAAGVALIGAFLGVLTLAAGLEMPLHTAIVFTSWVAICFWSVGGIAIEPIQWLPAGLHALFLPALVMYPEWLIELTGFAVCVPHGSLGVAWMLRARRGARRR